MSIVSAPEDSGPIFFRTDSRFLTIRYYSGVEYRIYAEHYQELEDLIGTVLSEIDYTESAEVESEGDTIIYFKIRVDEKIKFFSRK